MRERLAHRRGDMTNSTDIIIFSKRRSLQLKSLLKSINHYSDIRDEEISVIYTTVPEVPYDSLTTQFGCRFIQQGDFLSDLRGIVEGSDNDYVLFMVDDLIFKDSFSLRGIERFLDSSPEADCFSLRLGKNIQDGRAPQFSAAGEDMLVWETRKGLGRLWNCFWEVSASVYRKTLVTKYLRQCSSRKVSYPNPLESRYYSQNADSLSRSRLRHKAASDKPSIPRGKQDESHGLLREVEVLHSRSEPCGRKEHRLQDRCGAGGAA